MAETQFRVEVRTEGEVCIARLLRPDTGEVMGEVARCSAFPLTDPAVLEAWKAFIKAAVGVVLLDATAHLGGRITGWAEAGPGESVPGHTIPPSERN